MKKYKHKITGKVFIETDFYNPEAPNEKYYKLDSVARSFYLEKEFIVSSNDWEEVKEEGLYFSESDRLKEGPNYLITSFKNTTTVYVFKHDTQLKDMYCLVDGRSPFYDKADLLTNQQAVIYSVKNSKGEFALGEKVKTSKDVFTISKFEICGDDIIVRFKETWEHDGLELISKVKSLLHTTTDGKEIYEGDKPTLYLLESNLTFRNIHTVPCFRGFSKQDKEVADRYLTFTSEENRDKYIKENSKKFLFVSKDGVKIFNGDTYYLCIGNIAEKHIADEKLDWSEEDNGIRFYDKEKAEQYVKSNRKPIFVSADNVEYYESYDIGTNLFSVNPKNNFLERRFLVAQAIENKEYIHFHTKEARQEYIDNNKPKYSLADIEKAYGNTKSPTESPLFQSFKSELKKLGK